MRRSGRVTYAGTAPTLDYVQRYNETTRMPERSDNAHFVRGVKLTLGGTSSIVNTEVNAFSEAYGSGSTGWTAPTGTVK